MKKKQRKAVVNDIARKIQQGSNQKDWAAAKKIQQQQGGKYRRQQSSKVEVNYNDNINVKEDGRFFVEVLLEVR